MQVALLQFSSDSPYFEWSLHNMNTIMLGMHFRTAKAVMIFLFYLFIYILIVVDNTDKVCSEKYVAAIKNKKSQKRWF